MYFCILMKRLIALISILLLLSLSAWAGVDIRGCITEAGTGLALPGAVVTLDHDALWAVSGNSGSPVLNARGELVGLAFDGNKESLSSDVWFVPSVTRCVCVDIRYILFILTHCYHSPVVAEL